MPFYFSWPEGSKEAGEKSRLKASFETQGGYCKNREFTPKWIFATTSKVHKESS